MRGFEIRRFGWFGAIVSLYFGATLGLVGCGGSSDAGADAGTCVPGRVASCSCDGQRPGTKRCRSGGTFGRCICSDTQPSLDTRGGGGDGDTIRADSGRDTRGDAGTTKPRHQITLPVEVIGPDGTTEAIEVGVEDPERVERLYLRAYSIGYPYHLANKRGYKTDKASVRLNGGPWVDVDNDNVRCEEPEASARCVSGPFHTIDLTLPIGKLGSPKSGTNTLEFRFNYAHPKGSLGDPSTGYRILDVEFRDGSGNDRLAETSFEWDEPASWRAPEGFRNQTAVDAGEKLWHRRDHMVDGWNGSSITASCADCHTDTGYDLQYFAFSNHSIVQRSRFHGLTEKEGKQIAAYIRSIELETEDGTTYPPPGRPWDPPYQPGRTAEASREDGEVRAKGKGFDELPPAFWAAGAGLEWELDRDDEVEKFMFPDGVKYKGDVRIDASLNTRQLPVALQMPDWNEWLPVHHPIDVWGKRFTDSDVWNVYNDEVQPIDGDEKPGDVKFAAKNLSVVFSQTPKLKEFAPGSAPDPYDLGIASKSRARWALVKTFELLHVHHYEDDARDLNGQHAAPLQWLSTARTVFNQAPHITGAGDPLGDHDKIMDRYHDASWYHLMTVINSGQGIATGLKPVDWKYHFGHIGAVSGVGGSHAWRYTSSFLRLIQNAEHLGNKHFGANRHPEGWYLRHTTPTWMSTSRAQGSLLKGLSQSEYRNVLDVVMKAWIEGITGEPTDEWKRQTGQYGIEPSSFEPRVINRYQPGTGTHVEYASHIYTVAQRFKKWGMDQKLVRRLAQWGKKLWPKASNPSWDQIASN